MTLKQTPLPPRTEKVTCSLGPSENILGKIYQLSKDTHPRSRPKKSQAHFPTEKNNPANWGKSGETGGNGKNGGKWEDMREMRPWAATQNVCSPLNHRWGYHPLPGTHCGQHLPHLLALQPLSKPLQAALIINREHGTQTIDINWYTVYGAGTTPLQPYAWCVPSPTLYCLSKGTCFQTKKKGRGGGGGGGVYLT